MSMRTGFARARSVIAALAVGVVLAACQSYSPQALRVGDREDKVVGLLGAPTARHRLPDGGTRLVYARGPVGQHTYMVDLGADGGVRQWKQVLGELEFADIEPGWTADQVLLEFGPPGERRPNRPTQGEIWFYRYPTFECQRFQLEFDRDRRVVRGTYGIDPACDPPL